MAKNREPEKPVESESEPEEESSEEGSEPEPTVTTESAAKKPQPEDSESEEEEEEAEEGSESDSSSEEDEHVKPVISGGPKKLVTPAKPTSSVKPTNSVKRPAAAELQSKDSKKEKTKQTEVENSEKKSMPFQRLWSEGDEIALLKGMIDYAAKKKADPIADMNVFLEFIKKNIHIDVNKTQLQDKIRRLKKKYINNKEKENDGKDIIFLKSQHEQEAYELSKKIWDHDAVAASGGGTLSLKKKKAVVEERKAVQEEGKVGNLMLAAGLKLLGGDGSEEEMNLTRIGTMAFDGEEGVVWKKLLIDELTAYGTVLDVRRKKLDMVLDYLKS